MYGMIHRAMRNMVHEELAEDAWLALEQKLNIGPMDLLTGKVYDDALTLGIISEAAARRNLSATFQPGWRFLHKPMESAHLLQLIAA